MMTDTPIHVMYTDDDPDDRELFQEAMARIKTPNIVKTYADCDSMIEDLQALDDTNMDRTIIFLDINMPGKSGIQCLEEMRKTDRYAMIPIVMFTTSTSLIDVQESRRLRANLFLNKPLDFQEQILLLDKLLSPKGYEMLVSSSPSA